MADIDPALVEQVFDVSQRERKSNIQHDRQPDDFGRRVEVSEWVFRHGVEAKTGAGWPQAVLI